MTFSTRFVVFMLAVGTALSLTACGGSSASAGPGAGDSGTPPLDATATDSGTTSDAPAADTQPADGGGTPSTVTFSYKPQWSGATAVAVFGGFGQATDWKQPLVTLASDSDGGDGGGFTGTAQLPDGMYPYVFQVTGDVAAAMPSTYKRYVIDPTNPAYAACPMASPTYDKTNPNPCSELTVPQPAAAPMYHLTGTVNYDGAPKAGYLILLEREETGSHHFPANRTDSASDGTFDLVMASGKYRVQVQHPTFLSETDAQRDPLSLQAMRRSISTAAPITKMTTFEPVEVAYHDYSKLSPVDAGGTPPTTFNYTVLSTALSAHVAVYGPGTSIGDPWYSTPFSTATSAVFDGGFNTMQATEPAVVAGKEYWWGTWQLENMPSDGGIEWQGESMVFPITFQ